MIEQYDNRSVIEQIHSLSGKVDDVTDTAVDAKETAETISEQITPLIGQIEGALTTVQSMDTRVTANTNGVSALNTKVGNSTDTASDDGTLYARTKKLKSDFNTTNTTVGILVNETNSIKSKIGASTDTPDTAGSLYARAKANTQGVADNADAIEALEDELDAYQLKSEKNAASGYAGLNANTKVDNTYLNIGLTTDAILTAGAQLLDGEMLYISDGKVRSKPMATQGATYFGRFPSVASLPTGASNGDYAAVYGAGSDDGFYMWSQTALAWQKTLIFDANSYQLISNMSTVVDDNADNSHYPTTLAVKNFHNATGIDGVTVTMTDGSTIATTVDITNPNGQVVATSTANVTVDTAPTNNSTHVVQSGGVYTALAGKQNTLNATQLAVLSSGITAEKVTAYDGYASSKQDALSSAQINACDSGITSAKVTAYDNYASTKQNNLTSATITLTVAGWSNSTQTVTGITPVKADNIVWVSPTGASFADYGTAGIRVTAQANGSLTFTCTTTPTSAIGVVVVGA